MLDSAPANFDSFSCSSLAAEFVVQPDGRCSRDSTKFNETQRSSILQLLRHVTELNRPCLPVESERTKQSVTCKQTCVTCKEEEV